MHTRIRASHAVSALATGLVLALGLMLVPGSAGAQDMAMVAHPAHIHAGTCAELGDVVYPLTDVSADAGTPEASPVAAQDMGTAASSEMMGSPESMGEMDAMASPTSDMAMGTPASGPFGVAVSTSETIVEATLTDLTAGGYAINVHESAENIGNYIACGDIMGAPADNADVTIELATLNDSGFTGTATLHDNGDGTTTVTITLMQGEM